MSAASKPLSIVHITDSFHPEFGGVERVVENLGACQAKAGHRVFIVSKSIPEAAETEIYRGMKIVRYKRRLRPTLVNYLTSIAGSKKVFDGLACSERIDLVHCHLTLSSLGPSGMAAAKGIPRIVSFYGPWDREFRAEAQDLMKRSSPLYQGYLAFQMALQRSMQGRVLKRADRVVVLSDHSRLQAQRLDRGAFAKAVKIPGGIDAARFFPGEPALRYREEMGLPGHSLLIFTLRRLVSRMGVDLLIDAFERCVDQGLDAHLLIGGQGPLRDSLLDQARKGRATDRIHFQGFVPDERLADAYREADLVVLPTRTEENFGLPILEGAACGAPVIGTPVGSIPEVLGGLDPNLVTREASAESIAEKILWAADHLAEIRSRFLRIAQTVRERHDWMAVARKMDDLYFEVL